MMIHSKLFFFLFLGFYFNALSGSDQPIHPFIFDKAPQKPRDFLGEATQMSYSPGIGVDPGHQGEPSSLASIDNEPSALVNNCVNVITGEYTDQQVDLVVPGAVPLVLSRNYSSQDFRSYWFGLGWHLNHWGFLKKHDDADESNGTILTATVCDVSGSQLNYAWYINSGLTKVAPYAFSKGLTNCSGGNISGRNNIKNNLLVEIPQKNLGYFNLSTGAGNIKTFIQKKKHSDNYALTCEKLPNGNQITYEYNERFLPLYVKGRNSFGHEINSLKYDYKPSSHTKKSGRIKITSSDNRSVVYKIAQMSSGSAKDAFCIKEVIRSDAPNESYSYCDLFDDLPPPLCQKQLPNGRFLHIDYYIKGKNHTCNGLVEIDSKKDPRVGRVKTLLSPAGSDGSKMITHTFLYDLKPCKHSKKGEFSGGKTTVLDAHLQMTSYNFSDEHRLEAIDKFKGTGGVYSHYTREKLFWGDKSTPDGINLVGRTFEKADGSILFFRRYKYDKRGNVIKESLYGNLTGTCTVPIIIPDSKSIPIENGCECYVKKYEYSDDGKNLVTKTIEGPKVTRQRYHPGTDLLACKFEGEGDSIRTREFYDYNHNADLTKQITDNGSSSDKNDLSGVTQRLVKIITPRDYPPFSLPAQIEEKYVDLSTHAEILIKKTLNQYTKEGRLSQQDIYDSNGAYAYSLYWEYNRMGQVKKEIDALGQTTTRQYDENGNLTFEQGPRTDYHKKFTYDLMNRLVKEEEVHDDQTCLCKSYRYDVLGNRLASIDIYGNTTEFSYDEFGREIKITYPPVLNEHGEEIRPTTYKEYNHLGHIVLNVDARGIKTKTSYNLHGKPTLIEYPDGSRESFEYTLKGELRKEVAKNGTAILYTYDTFSRPIKKEVHDSQGNFLYSTQSTYDSYHLLSETDPMGGIKRFEYDGAGRLSVLYNQDEKTTYHYDALGRLEETRNYFGPEADDYVATIEKKDFLDRIIEKIIQSPIKGVSFREEYGYDADGNRTLVKTYNQAGIGLYQTQYNSHGKIIKSVTPDQGTIVTTYHYHFGNERGQCVPLEETVDPNGIKTITEKDALERIVKITRYDHMGNPIQQSRLSYDANGNQVCRFENLFQQNRPDLITKWQYDDLNRMIAIQEAFGTNISKQTQYRYNSYGQLDQIVKPNQTILQHTYDSLGRLVRYQGSDGSIDDHYIYDLNNHILSCIDNISKTATNCTYDLNGRMLTEQLGNGLLLQYAYDRMGRVTQLQLPDSSSIYYHYEGSFLKKVSRFSPTQEKLYEHTHTAFDLAGRLTEAKLVGDAGTVSYSFDLMQRPTEISSAHWQESARSYDKAGNLISRTINDAIGSQACHYQYDDLYQLTSETGIAENNYRHDSVYNRLNKNGRENVVNELNQLVEDGEASYRYDPNGNLSQKIEGTSVSLYQYDISDRMISFTKSQVKTCYQYDGFNRRISKETLNWDDTISAWKPQQKIDYLYLNQMEIGALEHGVMTQLKVLAVDHSISRGRAVALELNGKMYAPLQDAIGNITSLLDFSGNQKEAYRYSAFGEEQLFDDAGESLEESINPWRYAGKRLDAESGLISFGERYYSPQIGRWTTPDPLGLDEGPNLYAYVANSPMNWLDFMGLHVDNASVDYQSECSWSDYCWKGIGKTADFGKGISYGAFKSFAHYPWETNLYQVGSAWHRDGYSGMFATVYSNGIEGFGQMCGEAGGYVYQIWTGAAAASWAGKSAYQMCLQSARAANGIKSVGSGIAQGAKSGWNKLTSGWGTKAGGAIAEEVAPAANAISKEIVSAKLSTTGKIINEGISNGAQNVNAAVNLTNKFSQLENAQQAAVRIRTLANGRTRYYSKEILAHKPGPTRGACRVTEHNTKTGSTRSWHECYDHSGEVNRVHPKQINGQNVNSCHYPPTKTELGY